MSGIEIRVDASEIDATIIPRLERLADLPAAELMDAIGALGVSQTQRRIASEKTSPDGEAWQPNRRGGSILVLEGHLLGSIDHEASAEQASWGSPLVYAAIHQMGGVIKAKNGKRLRFTIGNQEFFPASVTIPARPYLGLSEANKEEIAQEVNAWIAERLQ